MKLNRVINYYLVLEPDKTFEEILFVEENVFLIRNYIDKTYIEYLLVFHDGKAEVYKCERVKLD